MLNAGTCSVTPKAKVPKSRRPSTLSTRPCGSGSSGRTASGSQLLGSRDGAHAEGGPLSYLLEMDGVRVLLDCGWTSDFDPQQLEPLRRAIDAKPIDAVLISHADLAHMGALPYAAAKLGLSCPVYATVLTFKMGKLFLYDVHAAISERGDDAVAAALEPVHRVVEVPHQEGREASHVRDALVRSGVGGGDEPEVVGEDQVRFGDAE